MGNILRLRWIFAFICIVPLMVTAGGVAFAGDNPLREVFPYGVYIGSGTNPYNDPTLKNDPERTREAIERVCKDLAEHNMNTAYANNNTEWVTPYWLEAGKKYGIRIIIQGCSPPMFVTTSTFKDKTEMVKSCSDFYKKFTDKYKDDEALLAYSITEEQVYVPWFYEGLAEVVRQMERWDPRHPAILLDNRLPSLWMSAQVVKPKVLAMDVYSFWYDGLSGPIDASAVRSLWTRQCRRARYAAESIDVPFWMMGQGMELIQMDGEGRSLHAWRYPTPEEIRWQFWSAIQEGAKGMFYFVYHGNRTVPESGSYISGLRGPNEEETPQFRMAAEMGHWVKILSPLLLKLDVAKPHEQVEYWENTPVSAQTHVHRETGQRFMSVVNNDCRNIQRIGVELAYWPGMLKPKEKLFDLRSGREFDYNTIKWATLLPGDGTIYFIGTEEEWQGFKKNFYAKQ